MSLLTCCFWWFVLGALVGWLLSWLVNRLFGRTGGPRDHGAAPAAGSPVRRTAAARVDDLVVIEGIGPKIAELLRRQRHRHLRRRSPAPTWRRCGPSSTRAARGSSWRTPAPGRRRPSTACAATGTA